MVVAAATGVVLDVAAVVVVAHLNFGACNSNYNDCVHHLVVDDVYVDTQKIHFLFVVFFSSVRVFLKVKGKPAWRTTVSIRNSIQYLLFQTSAPILISAA